jgi:hypothetical protein
MSSPDDTLSSPFTPKGLSMLEPRNVVKCGYNHKNLTNSWSRVLVKKLMVAQLLKIFQTLYRTPRFTPVFTNARHRTQL